MPETHWHDIEEISGIGQALGAELRSLGFSYTEDLLCAPASKIAIRLDSVNGLTTSNLLSSIIPQAELLRLRDISTDSVISLVEHGITSLRQFSLCDTQEIANLTSSNVENALNWQLDASRRANTGSATVEVFGPEGRLLNNARCEVASPLRTDRADYWRWDTNQRGRALLEYLSPGDHEVAVMAPNCEGGVAFFRVSSGGRHRIRIRLDQGDGGWIKRSATAYSPSYLNPVQRKELNSVHELLQIAPGHIDAQSDANGFRVSTLVPIREGVRQVVYWTWDNLNDFPFSAEKGQIIYKADAGYYLVSTDVEIARIRETHGDDGVAELGLE